MCGMCRGRRCSCFGEYSGYGGSNGEYEYIRVSSCNCYGYCSHGVPFYFGSGGGCTNDPYRTMEERIKELENNNKE